MQDRVLGVNIQGGGLFSLNSYAGHSLRLCTPTDAHSSGRHPLGVPICAWWCCSSAQRFTNTEPLKTGLIPWSSKGCGVSLRSLWVFAGREHLGKRSLRAWGGCVSAC